jgi:hypothetical protein
MQVNIRVRLQWSKVKKRQLKSSQAFHQTPCGWVRGTAVREQFELKNLKLFDPVAQDKTGFHPATIHKQHEQKSPPKITQTVTHTNLIQEQGISWMLHSGATETKQIQDVEIKNWRQDSRPKQIRMELKPGGAHGTEEKHER